MFTLRKKATGPVYGAIIDIGSGSVGVGIVLSQPENKLPILLYSHRTTMRITKNGGEKAENLRRVREALFSASLILSQEGMLALQKSNPKASITRLFVTCSSPWSYTIARDVHYENDEAFKITHEMLDDLVESAEAEIVKHLRDESAVKGSDFEIVERATVDVTVNDYPIHDPLGLKGTELGLSHIAGLIPKDILLSLHEVQDKLYPHTELRAHTYMLVMYCVLRDIFPRMHTYCIIDVTAEATEFGIVENNLLIENNYIPYGSNTLVRNIMDETNKPATDIISQLQNIGDHEDNSALNDTIQKFKEQVSEEITNILSRRMLPEDVIITAHKPLETLFKDTLSAAITEATEKKVNTVMIDQNLIQEVTQGASDDVYLAIDARFFHKLHGCGEIEHT